MNQKIKAFTATAIALSVLGTSGLVMAAETTGAAAAAADVSLNLNDMLTYAIQDEFLAQAEYDLILDSYDVTRPFSNIIKAEGHHIEELLPLFDVYDIAVPENTAASLVALPATLAEIYATGVVAEQQNIAMYESFLDQDIPADVREVFEELLAASEKHLTAFERAGGQEGSRQTGSSQGQGRNQGAGRGLSRI